MIKWINHRILLDTNAFAADTIAPTETIVSDAVILDDMPKKHRTVTVHARLATTDVDEVDKAADEELTSRSNMIARIVREWAKQRQKSPKPSRAR
jgi:hypothetical protein